MRVVYAFESVNVATKEQKYLLFLLNELVGAGVEGVGKPDLFSVGLQLRSPQVIAPPFSEVILGVSRRRHVQQTSDHGLKFRHGVTKGRWVHLSSHEALNLIVAPEGEVQETAITMFNMKFEWTTISHPIVVDCICNCVVQ